VDSPAIVIAILLACATRPPIEPPSAGPTDLAVEALAERATFDVTEGVVRFADAVEAMRTPGTSGGRPTYSMPLRHWERLTDTDLLSREWRAAIVAGRATALHTIAPLPLDPSVFESCDAIRLGALPCAPRSGPFPTVPAFTLVPDGVVLLLPVGASPPDLDLTAPIDQRRLTGWSKGFRATAFVQRVARGGSLRQSVLLPPPASLSLDVDVPRDGALTFATTLDRLGRPAQGSARVAVSVGGEVAAAFAIDGGDRFTAEAVDLARWGGQTVRLSVAVTAEKQDLPLVVAIANPRVGARARVETARPTSVLLVTVDTLRADALGLYGSPRPTSPGLDAWARDADVFDQAFATAPWTLPAITSILTGVYPVTHQAVVEGATAIPREVTLLSETLRNAGRTTYAFVANPVEVGSGRDFDRGFQRFDEAQNAPASAVVDGAIAFLSALDPAEPFFAWLLPFDPHQPYEAPGADRDRFLPSGVRFIDGEHVFAFQVALLSGRLDAKDPRTALVMAGLRAQYDGEVAFLDGELARLFAKLGELGRADDTIVVVTADHGESFGQHGEIGHGALVYTETTRVPFLMKGPGVPTGRESGIVSTAAIAPTIQALLGLPIPSTAQALPLLGANHQPDTTWIPSETRAFAHPHYGWKDLVLALRSDRRVCVVEPTARRILLGDRMADPSENALTATNDGAEHDACAEAARAYLALPAMSRAWTDRLPPERLEALRALGYVH
jgi:arylsulfatase A-like enzyme